MPATKISTATFTAAVVRAFPLLPPLALALAVLIPAQVEAGYSCQTRKSGSVTIVSCSDGTTCRSYSVVKTSCS